MTTISDEELYTGLHAFVFIKEVDPGRSIADVVDDIADPERFSSDNGRVLFASVAVGSYIGFAHVRADDGDLAGVAAVHLPGPVGQGRWLRACR
jgi:hypothetical protein